MIILAYKSYYISLYPLNFILGGIMVILGNNGQIIKVDLIHIGISLEIFISFDN